MIRKISIFVLLVILLIGCSNEDTSSNDETLEGDWYGSIETPNAPLPIEISFETGEELSGTISIPAQNLHDFSLSKMDYQDGELSFDMDIPGQVIRFKSTNITDERIEGDFHQQGATFPFYLEKTSTNAENTEDDTGEILTVESTYGELKGELVVPEQATDTVALIIPGSGPTDRDGNTALGKNNSLKFLAEFLKEEGIASLRYDKRGAGLNTEAIIAEEDMSFDDFIDDVVVWLEKLNEEEQFERIIVIGHSQGSLVGMLAAVQADVDAFISIAGAGRPIDEVLREQLRAQLEGQVMEEANDILDELKEGNLVDDVSQPLQSTFRKSVQPFLMSWMKYDPTEEIKQLDVPMLIINGTTDLQVPVEDAEKLVEAADEADLAIIDDMNHVLKDAPSDENQNIQTYNQPNLPLSTGLTSVISDFLNENGF